MLKKFLYAFVLTASTASGIEYRPWYETLLEVEVQTSYTYQHFKKIASSQHSLNYISNDSFLHASVGGSYFEYFGELDLTFSQTRKRNFSLDCYSIEGRYQIFDDVAAVSPFSLTGGLILAKASRPALHDIGSFHHAQLEAEAHLALGKEFSSNQFWSLRSWGIFALGMGDTGSPWVRCNAVLEKNFWNRHQFGLWVNTLWGLGGNNLSKIRHFQGYGPIDHRSVDLGGTYRLLFDYGSELSFSYAYRVYAKNFPENASLLTLNFLYPIGL